MKARILGLALVAAGFSAPAFAGDNPELAAAMKQHGVEASTAIRQDLAIRPSSERFEQVYAELRALPRNNTRLAEVSEMPTLDASSVDSGRTEAVSVRGASASAAASAMQAVSPGAEEARSTARVLRMTFGIGLFGLSWNR